MRGLGRSLTLVRKLAVTLFSIEENDGAQERVIRGFEPHCGEPDHASASGAQLE